MLVTMSLKGNLQTHHPPAEIIAVPTPTASAPQRTQILWETSGWGDFELSPRGPLETQNGLSTTGS